LVLSLRANLPRMRVRLSASVFRHAYCCVPQLKTTKEATFRNKKLCGIFNKLIRYSGPSIITSKVDIFDKISFKYKYFVDMMERLSFIYNIIAGLMSSYMLHLGNVGAYANSQ